MNAGNNKKSGIPTLKSIRRNRGLTQKDVENLTKGTHCFIPQSRLSAWETALNVPNINNIIFLAGIYKVSYQELTEAWNNTQKIYIEDGLFEDENE